MLEILRWISLGLLWLAIAINVVTISMNIRTRKNYLAAQKKVEDLFRDLGERPRMIFCRDCSYSAKASVNDKGFLICPASGMDFTEYDFCSYGTTEEVFDEGRNYD